MVPGFCRSVAKLPSADVIYGTTEKVLHVLAGHAAEEKSLLKFQNDGWSDDSKGGHHPGQLLNGHNTKNENQDRLREGWSRTGLKGSLFERVTVVRQRGRTRR